ncbi:MAG: SIP domain-containing protein [Micropruina sp.]|uniref:SIP domain-containing protein n=1 Tax=Micropruina sp. TaxID=2737536 RepID=UPI0039E399F3
MPRTCREQRTFPINVRRLRVARIVDLSPGLRRITLTGEQLGAFSTEDGIAVPPLRSEGFDDHVKVIVAGPGQDAPVPPIQVPGHLNWAPPGGRPHAKDYTPRRWDPVAGELDLEFVRHGDGAAARWAETVAVGDPAWIAGPKSSALLPTGIDWLLVAGDETALPAIGRLLDEVPDDLPLRVLIEVPDARYEVPLPQRPLAVVQWVHRGAAAPGTSGVLADAVRNLAWLDGQVYAWVAGEASTIKPIRTHLKNDRLLPREQFEVTGYWRRSERHAVADTGPVPPGHDIADVADDEPDVHEQLHRLADLVGPYALRAAVTCGLIEALDGQTSALDELAEAIGSHRPTLEALVRVLVAREVLEEVADAAGPARYGLGPIGQEIAEDEHSLQEYHLDGAVAARDLVIGGLRGTLADGRAAVGADGRNLAARLAGDPALAADWWRAEQDLFRWPAPSIAERYDWSQHDAVAGLGVRSVEAVVAIARAHPRIRPMVVDLPSQRAGVEPELLVPDLAGRLEWVEQAPLTPPADGGTVLLMVQALERLADEDAVAVVRSLLGGGPREIVLVEEVSDELAHEEEFAEADLLARCAFGVGIRSADRVAGLLSAAGASTIEVVDIGWDRRLFSIR